jgi:hypothetical protein
MQPMPDAGPPGEQADSGHSHSERRPPQPHPDAVRAAGRHPKRSAAIVDLLTYAGQIIETGTTSYRLAQACTAKRNKLADHGPAPAASP